ncbi:MAG: choice-of-anchor Q domain-containing protein, partial [Planctomycetota bacterium]
KHNGNLDELTGTITSLGFNLSDRAPGQLDHATDIVHVDPLLGNLEYNGGLIRTHALLEGSAAIDAGSSQNASSVTRSGNGAIRNAIADIGAYENLTAATGVIYWADVDAGTIVRGNPDTGTSQVIASGLDLPVGVTVDLETGKIYWTEVGSDTVSRANLDGTDVEVILGNANFGNNPIGITVDPVNEKLYVVDGGAPSWITFFHPDLGLITGDQQDRIIVSDLDGSNAQVLLVTPTQTPTDLTIDYINGNIYWSDPIDDSIYAADIDGSNIRVIVSDAQGPASLAVDFHGGFLYWTDNAVFGTDVLRRMDLSTGVVGTYTAPIQGPIGMAFDQDTGMLYWSEQDELRRLDTNNPNASPETVFTGSLPFDVEAFSIGANSPPIGANDKFNVVVPNGATTVAFTGNVTANDSDPDGETMIAILIDGPMHAQSFDLAQDGTFNYSPTDGFRGLDSFT